MIMKHWQATGEAHPYCRLCGKYAHDCSGSVSEVYCAAHGRPSPNNSVLHATKLQSFTRETKYDDSELDKSIEDSWTSARELGDVYDHAGGPSIDVDSDVARQGGIRATVATASVSASSAAPQAQPEHSTKLRKLRPVPLPPRPHPVA